MILAIICLPSIRQKKPSSEEGYEDSYKDWQYENIKTEQCLAIAMYMRDAGALAPVIVCQKDSLLEKKAIELDLPFFSITNASSLVDRWRIWRWQKKNPALAIIGIGQSAMKAANLIYGHRKKNCMLNYAFFLEPPVMDRATLKLFKECRHCISGNEYIQEQIYSSLQAVSLLKELPDFIICQPGINLEPYNFPPAEYTSEDEAEGKHFVFGMAESLLPQSGALLVVRAMAALWQKEDLPPWEVRMFGSGPRYNEILSEARKLGVASRLSLLGDQPLPDVICYCHVWLAPGVSNDELPEVLCAGLLADIPVICAASPRHAELLKQLNKEAVLYLEKENPQEMAKAMIQLMGDPSLRQRMSAAAKTSRQQIGVDRMAGQICESINKWLGE